MSLARALALLLAGSLAAFAAPAWGFHTVFHFHVDRFEADGNVFGPADGVPDFVDEFDGDSLGDWTRLYGTVSVGDGMLHLESPGEHFWAGFTADVSEMWSTTLLNAGGGPTVITSYWMPPTMTPGSSLHMTLALTDTVTDSQFVGMHVAAGLDGVAAIGMHVIERNGHQWTPLAGQTIPFDPATVGDRLALRMVMDQGTVTGSFALDGIAFQQHAFVVPVAPGMTGGRVMLGADPIAPPKPGCGNFVVEEGEECDLGRRLEYRAGCCTDSCKRIDADADGVCDAADSCPTMSDPVQVDRDGDGLGDACDPCTTTTDGQQRWGRAVVALGRLNDDRVGNESLRMAGSFALPPDAPALDPIATGARIVVRSEHDGSTVDVALPGGAYVAPGPGWETDGTRFVFRDRRPGGTHGVRKMVVRPDTDGRIRLSLAAPRGAFELGAWSYPPIRASVAFGAGTDTCAEIRFAERACAYPASRRIICR